MKGSAKGFTLIELTFAIFLIAILSSIALPTLSNILGVNLRRGATEVAGFLRSAYERSVMHKERIRVHFNIEKGTYWAEAYVPSQPIPLLHEESNLDDAMNQFEDRVDTSFLDDEEELEKARKASFQKMSDGELKRAKLPSRIRFKGLYSIGNEGVSEEGNSWVDFAPGGFASETIIYVANNSNDVYSIVLRALGGKAKVKKGELRPSDL